MFCDLNGATDTPASAKMRHSAAVISDLPTCELVPSTMIARRSHGIRSS